MGTKFKTLREARRYLKGLGSHAGTRAIHKLKRPVYKYAVCTHLEWLNEFY